MDFKLRRLILPLLLLSFAFTIAYSLLNWLLVAKTGLIPLMKPSSIFGYPLHWRGFL